MSMSMRVPVVCGVDVGSTNTKVVALDPSGAVVARSARPTPRETVELTVQALAVVSAVEEMLAEVCGDRFVVHAASVAGVGEDGILLGQELDPLTPALAWFDPRRQEAYRTVRAQLGALGDPATETDPVRALAGWHWARSQVADSDIRWWVALTDVVSVAWTGRPFMSDTLAPRTGAWRTSDREWSAARVEACLGDVDRLPPVIRTGEIVGALQSDSLAAAGFLASHAVVVAGGHDHPIAGWGVDQMLPGAVLDSMGTAEVVVAQSPAMPDAIADAVEHAPGIRSSGTTVLRVEELARNVQWASQELAVAQCIRALLEGRAAPARVWESGWFIPGHRGGGVPAFSPEAPADPHLRASAVLGALAKLGKDAVDAVLSEAAQGAEVRMAGGWVRSPGWIDIKSAVNGYRAAPILEPEVTAVGVALLAATAIGWTPDPARALGGFSASMLTRP